jgi:hypothetical protein
MASQDEALNTQWKKRWPHRKKLYVPTGSGDDINGRCSISSLEEEIRLTGRKKSCTHTRTHTRPSWPTGRSAYREWTASNWAA